jgi:hypothetical protein
MKLLIVSLKFAPAHAVHMNALVFYAKPEQVSVMAARPYQSLLDFRHKGFYLLRGRAGLSFLVDALLFPWRLLCTLTALRRAAEGAHVFIQSPHFLNLLALLVLRLLGAKQILYYLHEPSSWKDKVGSGDSHLRALVTHGAQSIDCMLSDVTLVSAHDLVERTRRVTSRARSIRVAPLLYKPVQHQERRRVRLTYIGSISRNRAFEHFVRFARNLSDHVVGLIPTVLTSSTLDNTFASEHPSLDIHAGRPFSEQEKALILEESFAVWNVYTKSYSQSGVTGDSLRFGCPLLITEFEPLRAALSNCAYELVLPIDERNLHGAIAHISARLAQMSQNARQLFPAVGGALAWRDHYAPLFV